VFLLPLSWARQLHSLSKLSMPQSCTAHCGDKRNNLHVEIYALLEHYAAYSGNSLPTFRNNLPVPYSRVQLGSLTFKMGPISCLEVSVRNRHSTQRIAPEERRSHLHRGASPQPRTANVFYDVRPFKT